MWGVIMEGLHGMNKIGDDKLSFSTTLHYVILAISWAIKG